MNSLKILVSVMLLSITFAEHSNATTIIDWSGSKESVKNTSKNKLVEEKPNSLTFEARLFELDFNLEYIFDGEGKLNHILYYRSFLPGISDCVAQYQSIKAVVEKQQGNAETIENIYNDKIDTSAADLCKYVATGEYKLETNWQGKSENTNLVMSTWKGTPYIGLSYSPVGHK